MSSSRAMLALAGTMGGIARERMCGRGCETLCSIGFAVDAATRWQMLTPPSPQFSDCLQDLERSVLSGGPSLRARICCLGPTARTPAGAWIWSASAEPPG